MCVAHMLTLMGCPAMGDVLRLYGYTEIRPPSKFFAPGTMVWVKNQKPFEAGIICTSEASLGYSFQPMASATATMDLSRSTNRDFGIDADYLKLIRADARFSQVGSITVKIEHPVLYELVDTDVLRHGNERSLNCRRAVALRRDKGFQISMIASALRADVTYTVQWSNKVGLGTGANAEVLQALAGELGAEHATVSGHTITAKNLYWGIKDDAFLAQLTEPHRLQGVAKRGRLLTPTIPFSIHVEPDVP
jgi:hypothetical protein